MFEALEGLSAAWRTVAHISAWTGLSVGALVVVGVCIYLDPAARRVCFAAAGAVLLGWACLMYGHSAGVADEAARLKTISDQADTRAADKANTDESAIVADIKERASKQHDEDLATIAGLKAGGADCGFDPGATDGRLPAHAGGGAGAIGRNAKPAAGAKASDKGATGSGSGHRLPLPLVWRRWLPWQKHDGDAAPNGE